MFWIKLLGLSFNIRLQLLCTVNTSREVAAVGFLAYQLNNYIAVILSYEYQLNDSYVEGQRHYN